MRTDQSWMLRRKDHTGIVREEFSNEDREFMNVVREYPSVADRKGRIPYSNHAMNARYRGNRIIEYGRGSRSIESSLPSPPHVQNPPHSSQSLHSEPQSPGVTSTVQPIIGSDPPVVPSSVDSRTGRTVRKNVLYVDHADDPKRFNNSKVNRDIISTVIMRMPNPAPVWKRYSEHMATTLLNNFMVHAKLTIPS
ncbi:hypothetical protein RIF29_24848 [Crotalaria pallida]|uniref:Uncharacterized protein n=1 Tax=Crotalaria pallida TaxID=3830 RepID=A0AAN9EMY9_CROPI